MAQELLQQAFSLLNRTLSTPVSDIAREQLRLHASLIRKWNPLSALISDNDLPHIEDKHQTDSLSLVPYIYHRTSPPGSLLDIGAGAGFPIIPIKCVLPHLNITIVERNHRKVGFILQVIAALRLENISVIHGSFPDVPAKIDAQIITARAVERPQRFIPLLLKRLPPSCSYLCQSPLNARSLPQMFHVEPIQDVWKEAGLRRSELHIITYRPLP